jgi:membrane peptidoglycan carboxypeptidase
MGPVTVRLALEQSLNSASVRIGLATGIAPILKTARTLGVTTEMDDSNPAILLGAVGIPPIEMAQAYSTIARQGAIVPLHAVRFITDDRGKAVEGTKMDPVQVFPARDVYILTHVMRGVVDNGTAARSRGMGYRKIAAGKTGTTNDKRDAWFIGFTPQTLALTWVGFDDNDPTGLSGSDAAVPMWTRFMLATTAGQPNRDFPAPSGVVLATVDKSSGGLATPSCPANMVVQMAFKAGTEPRNPCAVHGAGAVAPPPVPMYDANGNLITPGAPTDTAALPPVTTGSDTPPESTLTGGVFRNDTAVTPPPPTTTTQEPEPEPEPEPPPPTDTSTTTSGPPRSL